jgi:uncharacterized protein
VITYRTYLKQIFPQYARVQKVSVDAGFTCPNIDGTKGKGGCVYCNNKSFAPSLKEPAAQKISLQLLNAIEKKARLGQNTAFLAYFQPYTNTYGNVEHLRELYEEALAVEGVCGLCLGTRPDCLGDEVLALLEDLGKKHYVQVEVGLQSSHDSTLQKINRLHTFQDFANAMDALANIPVHTGVHLVFGLPGESEEHMLHTVESIRPWHYHAVKIHPMQVVKNTVLAAWYKQGTYTPLTREAYMSTLIKAAPRLRQEAVLERIHADAGDWLIAPKWSEDRVGLWSDLQKACPNLISEQKS